MTSTNTHSDPRSADKIRSLAEAVDLIRDGDVVAIGGHAGRRHPMALVREIIRQGKRRLHLVGWNNGIDIDTLVGAGCVETVECATNATANPAHNLRRAAESGRIRVIEHAEETALDRFRAGAAGLPMMPSKATAGPHLKPFTDPFTGETWMAVQAIRPDVAILHAHAADAPGNVQQDAERRYDVAPDVLIARSARTVIVSVEQIVSEQAVAAHPTDLILPGGEVAAIVEAPYGAHPCACDSRYDDDLDHLRQYQEASASPDSFAAYLDACVHGLADHRSYLDALGMRRLMGISTKRTHRG